MGGSCGGPSGCRERSERRRSKGKELKTGQSVGGNGKGASEADLVLLLVVSKVGAIEALVMM